MRAHTLMHTHACARTHTHTHTRTASFGGDENQGYCLVDTRSEGVNGVFRTESLALAFPIPESFPAIDVYIDRTDRVGSSNAVSDHAATAGMTIVTM